MYCILGYGSDVRVPRTQQRGQKALQGSWLRQDNAQDLLKTQRDSKSSKDIEKHKKRMSYIDSILGHGSRRRAAKEAKGGF